MIVAGVVSTGGVTALAARTWLLTKGPKEASGRGESGKAEGFPSLEKENEYDTDQRGTKQSCIAG
jgi:hypothetical protein